MIGWLKKNRKWLFSGLGIAIIMGIAGYFRISKENLGTDKPVTDIKVSMRDSSSSVIIKRGKIKGYIAGRDMIINQVSLNSHIDELIAILQLRAENIKNQLSKYYKYAQVDEYIRKFEDLHSKHVKALKEGNFTLAHEILNSIHKISFKLESNEFWMKHKVETPNVLYNLREDAFQRGRLICEYIVGDMKPYSSLCPYDRKRGFLRNRFKRNQFKRKENTYELILRSYKNKKFNIFDFLKRF